MELWQKYFTIGELVLDYPGNVIELYEECGIDELGEEAAKEFLKEYRDKRIVVYTLYPTASPLADGFYEDIRKEKNYIDVNSKVELAIGYRANLSSVVKELVDLIEGESLELYSPVIVGDFKKTEIYFDSCYNGDGLSFLIGNLREVKVGGKSGDVLDLESVL